MKRILAVISLILALLFVVSCGKDATTDKEQEKRKSDLKIGVLLEGDASNPDTLLHQSAIQEMIAKEGLEEKQVEVKTGITADKCFETVTAMVESGCNLIFAHGDFEDYLVQSATENEAVQYCVADGTQAQTSDMANLHSFSIPKYKSSYIAGVAAGLKLKDQIDHGELLADQVKIGYVGDVACTETTSMYSAFYIGVRSVVPTAKMEVQYAGKKNSENLERIAANALIANGCTLIAQKSYTNGAAETCEKNGKYFIGGTCSASEKAPNFAVASTSFSWVGAYDYAVECIIKGETVPTEWCKETENEPLLTEINKTAFSAEDKANEAQKTVTSKAADVLANKIHVFDTSKWKVDKKVVTTTNDTEQPNTYLGKELISKDKYFMEQESTALPEFSLSIDGISVLN